MPTLVSTLVGTDTVANNVGGSGIARFSPDFEFNQDSWLQYSRATLRAKLTFPAQPLAVRAGMTNLPAQRACLPTSFGHTGAAWRFLRDGTQIVAPDIEHLPILQTADSNYPRFDSEINYTPAPGGGGLGGICRLPVRRLQLAGGIRCSACVRPGLAAPRCFCTGRLDRCLGLAANGQHCRQRPADVDGLAVRASHECAALPA